MTIDIVGAGIGGLTTAIVLQQKGIKTRVFERASKLLPVGAGIVLASNAMQVYKTLGLHDAIEQGGNSITSMNITNANLKAISSIDLKYFEEKYQVRNVAIHRGKLQQILAEQLKPSSIYFGHELIDLKQLDRGNVLTFSNGKTIESDLTIGADGLNSMVRRIIFPNEVIRNANQVCWRGISDLDLPNGYRNELNEAWGKADRFGFVQIAPGKTYWYALKTMKEPINEYSIDQVRNYFIDYHLIIRQIMDSTNKGSIHCDEIQDLKPGNNWYINRTCLIGDAAHATTPNMGQGACQAIEDAYALSHCLDRFEMNEALSEYVRIRLAKAHGVVKRSWMLGKMAHLSNPLLIAFRDLVMKITPDSAGQKQIGELFELTKV